MEEKMKRIRKVVMSIISCILAFSIFCISTSAAEVVMGITDEITRNNAFPLEVTISSISEDENEVSLIISVKTAFSVYQNVSLRITELQSDEVLYSNLYNSANTISISGLSTADTYCIYLMMYTGSDNKEYEAILSFESNDVVELKLNYTELVNNVTDASKKQQEEKNSEASKKLYESMFNDLEIPPFIDEDIARETGHILQMEEFNNNKNIIGYENSDGTKTVYLFSSPVKYEDAEGKLHNAVPKIVKAEATAQKNGYAFMNDYGKVKTYYSDSLTNTNAVKIQNEDIEFEFGFSIPKHDSSLLKKITMTVLDFFVGDSNKAELSTSNKQQVLQYNKINDGNMQIVAEPTICGAKQTLILKSAPQSNKISFWVKNNNYSARQAESNASVEFYNGEKSAYSIGNVEIRDSFDGEDASGAIHFSVNNTLKILESTNTQTLVEVSLDEEMINSPITSYPVAISLYATTSDTTVDYTYFEDRMVYNNGTSVSASSPYLIVGKNGTYSETDYYEYYNETTCQYEIVEYTTTHDREGIAFMKYDLCAFSGLEPSNIQSANLILHEGSGNSGGVQIDLKRVTTNWSENNVTSNYINYVDNYYAGNSYLYMSTSSSGLEHSFDITQMTTEHLITDLGLSGGITNYGFQLRSYASAPGKHFYSSEHSTIAYRPQLVITYREPQTPSDLGLSTSKVYLLKNLNTSKYLSVANGHQVDGTTVKQESKTYDTNMYWKLEYLSDTGEYRFIPMNATGSRLDVITSSNSNGADVGIYNNGGYESSKWKIIKNGTNNYSILSAVSYGTKGLKASGINIVIYDSASDDHWQFVEATCDGTSANYVDTHVLDLYQPNSSTIKYKCILCGKEFNSPEYDDREILDDADYMTVYTLQQLFEYEFANRDYLKAEGCLKTIDKIRQRNAYKQNGVSKYQYRNSNGAYITPNDYEYTSSTVRLEISTKQITTGGFLLNSLFTSLIKNSAEILLQPFDKLSQELYVPMTLIDLIDIIGNQDEYTLAENRHAATNWIANTVIGALEFAPPKIATVAGKFSKVLLVAGILYDTYQIARDQTRLPGNYTIRIDIYTSLGVDTFIGDYGYKYYNGSYSPSKHMKNIINEYFDPWDNGTYNPTKPPIYGHATISYSGLQYSGGSSKTNDDFGI